MKPLKRILVVFLLMSSFLMHGCKPSVPGIYISEKDGTSMSVELKPDGTYRIFDDKGAEASGKYIVNDNMITFIMFGKENKGEIKRGRIIMEDGVVWKKK